VRPSYESDPATRLRQRGTATVEFALIASLIFSLLFGILEMSRILFYWNTATEVTRLGARLAVVCNKDAAIIKTKMIAMLNILSPGNINITYMPVGCDINSCQSVMVSLTDLNISTFIPLLPLSLNLPSFSTTLPRESMDSINPDCS
jgi:TadE-like protein